MKIKTIDKHFDYINRNGIVVNILFWNQVPSEILFIEKDDDIIYKCTSEINDFYNLFGVNPGVFIVGWKTYAQIQYKYNEPSPLTQYFNPFNIKGEFLYYDKVIIIVNSQKDFYIKAHHSPEDSIDIKLERDKVLIEFNMLAKRAMNSGIKSADLKKIISNIQLNMAFK